jgi:hypothetical protein
MSIANTDAIQSLFRAGLMLRLSMTMTEHGNGKSANLVCGFLLTAFSIKTRQRYVQLSEQSLEEKKKHCMLPQRRAQNT